MSDAWEPLKQDRVEAGGQLARPEAGRPAGWRYRPLGRRVR
jgi:hypothetical protein